MARNDRSDDPAKARRRPAAPAWVPWVSVSLGTPAALLVGLLAGSQWLLPLLSVAPFYPWMVAELRGGRRRRAVLLGLGWALVLGVSATVLFQALPERAEAGVWNGAAYRAEMNHWLETGEGAEGDPALFLPQHALHAGLFAALCLASAGLAGIVMGAALMHYMAFYVAGVAGRSSVPLLAGLAGWHPWSLVRVAAFVVMGVVLSEPMVARLSGRKTEWRALAPWLLAAAAGLVVDATMKGLMAETWRHLLAGLLS